MKYLTPCVMMTVLTGCQSVSSTPSQKIIGVWESEIGGFPITHEYGESTVSIPGHEAVNYEIQDDVLTLDTVGASERIISFPSENEMHQTDLLTGTIQKFSRR
ncbi:MAG TPA: hypothetical protein DCM54_11200 [Gammaproteobacteria bacterium]|nr:hypothetical protein [Gammaproteobacteria bacterium]